MNILKNWRYDDLPRRTGGEGSDITACVAFRQHDGQPDHYLRLTISGCETVEEAKRLFDRIVDDLNA